MRDPYLEAARAAIAHCHWIAARSEDAGRITRTFLSPPMREVHEHLGSWMSSLGMSVRVDAAGNQRGATGDGPTVIIGSHLDTVPDAGPYDGVLGVVIGISLVQLLAGRALPVQLEVIGFSDEEGVRFGVPFIGSRALVGDADTLLPCPDRDGLTVGAALRSYGLDPSRIADARASAQAIAYLEFHIEQGPVLEGQALPLGVVETVAGQSRVELTFTGKANHAGTTPMAARRDALAGAAEWVGLVEHEAVSTPGLVATVGRVHATPNVGNAINGTVVASLDVRHEADHDRRRAVDRLLEGARAIAARRGLAVSHRHHLDQAAVPMSPALTEALAQAVAATGRDVHRMTSGAGHDAMIVARRLPSAMLFLRSPGGISHHPDEQVLVDDVAAALEVGVELLTHLPSGMADTGTVGPALRARSARTTAMHDVVIRGGTLVTPDGLVQADVAIVEGRIAAIAPELPSGRALVDATGLHIFPGVVDAHVHFNEPGRTDWEGGETGSRALAAGGGTTFVDMPLNSTPCTVNAVEFARKRAALSAASIADFALWGGLVPGNREDLADLADAGAVGFKAFMSNSGLPEFPRADDLTLLEGMAEAARLGLPVAVHAESEEITAALSHRLLAGDRAGVREVLASRPVIAEVEAIARAVLLASETGARLHIVHVSSGRGVAVAAEARARGVDITIETCPHYLCFTTEDVERIGVAAKCAPPIRDATEREALWRAVLDGTVDLIGSDHSPAPPEQKTGGFARAWGGIAGVQATLAVLLECGYHARGLPLTQVASLLAGRPAARFGLGRKGAIRVGLDADLALVALDDVHTFDRVLQRHAMSPYLGMSCRGAVRSTIRRGETIVADGSITARTRGQLVTCTR